MNAIGRQFTRLVYLMLNANGRFRLDQKRALVTGASRGLGAEIASALAAAGADLVISGRDPIGLQHTAQVVRQRGGSCQEVQADLRSTEAVQRLADQALERFGTIDILVNNAGIVHVEDLLHPTLEHWEEA